jgi:hypothetical protein
MKTIYKSKDGIEFSSRKECKEHEMLLDKARDMAEDKHYHDMGESAFADALLELHNEGKIKIL